MKPYRIPKITVHGSLVDITKMPFPTPPTPPTDKPAGSSDQFGSGVVD